VSNFESILNAGRMNDIRLIGMITLLFILGVILIGMDWMTRVQIVLLVSNGQLGLSVTRVDILTY
jgi:hypothetical protein